MTQPTRAEISGVAPLFIVRNVITALASYRDKLGFEITLQQPADDPFFGIVNRGGAMLMLKAVRVEPLPNHQRDDWAHWDAYFYVPDLDALASEFKSRNVEVSEPLKDTQDNLRGFEVTDLDMYCSSVGQDRDCGCR